jgi:hypothetical protein
MEYGCPSFAAMMFGAVPPGARLTVLIVINRVME